MTLTQILQGAVKRVGLDETNSDFTDQARFYANIVAKDIASKAVWWWLFKTTTITTTADTGTYELASDVLYLHNFRDQTNDWPLEMMGMEELDYSDPDNSRTGSQRFVIIEGIDATNGTVTVRLFPTPDTSSDSIRYRYYAFLDDWSSSDDSTDMKKWIHPTVQPALMYGISRLYMQEKSETEGAQEEEKNYGMVLKAALKQNMRILGNRRFRMRRTDNGQPFNFYVTEGSLT